MAASLQTSPASFVMATTETLPLGFDTTALLSGVQTPSSPSAVLEDLVLSQPVSLSDSPTIVGNVITQIVRGTELKAGHKYALSMTFTAAVATVWTMVLVISVPQ